MFSPSNKLFILVNTDYSLVKMTSYCLNPNLVCASLVLQSMITLVAYSLCKKILLSVFLVHLLIHIYVFHGLKETILWSTPNFHDLILLPYVFHSTTVFHHFLLLFLCHLSHTFFSLYQPYLYSIFHRSFRDFDFFSHLIIFS